MFLVPRILDSWLMLVSSTAMALICGFFFAFLLNEVRSGDNKEIDFVQRFLARSSQLWSSWLIAKSGELVECYYVVTVEIEWTLDVISLWFNIGPNEIWSLNFTRIRHWFLQMVSLLCIWIQIGVDWLCRNLKSVMLISNPEVNYKVQKEYIEKGR